ncbi:zinc finger CCCH domain-containing protein 62-like isoform X2 [Neltuma alba]|uniref:zinc finger CCCH domain-containing protein 62-like isoform X2 n=1 Tax=Neltuma alba TaxID=207710 RepID=UPI0010A348A7|nr:zinc finger CCCH domain-containing protein 62-like isoform X2 [Prosopis alba]
MVEPRGKRAIIVLSSSSSEEIDDHDMEDSISDDDCADDEEEGQSLDDDDENSDDSDDESLSNKVFALFQGSDLKYLKFKECKAYLRKNGLRLAGNRDVCIERIREHWRIKDGRGYTLYPRSSFIIDCTGDVCKGDVVLFRQMVYEKFDKVSKRGRHVGKRTVAGRVVKESYGATKQQHTFTVEVIWSDGVKKFPPLFPLLVKGRNLYKLKTYRQRWKHEAERVKVLSEKHQRGAEARLVRATRQKKGKWSANGGFNGHCEIRHTKPSKLRVSRTYDMGKVKQLDGHRRAISGRQPLETTSTRQAARKTNASSRTFRSASGWDESVDCYQLPVHSFYANYSRNSHQSKVNCQKK